MIRPVSFLQRESRWHDGFLTYYVVVVAATSPLLSVRDLAGCVLAGLMVGAAVRVRDGRRGRRA